MTFLMLLAPTLVAAANTAATSKTSISIEHLQEFTEEIAYTSELLQTMIGCSNTNLMRRYFDHNSRFDRLTSRWLAKPVLDKLSLLLESG